MAYTAPTTHVAGETLPAADYNVIVNDVIDHESRIRQAAVMASFVSGTAYTTGASNPIPFGGENYDTDGFHDNTTNNSRITIPTGLGGTYMLEAHVMIDYSTQPSYVDLSIRANGSMENNRAIRGGIFGWPTGVSRMIFKATGIVYNCVATDYFDVTIATSGGSFTATPLVGGSTTVTATYFRAARIAAA